MFGQIALFVRSTTSCYIIQVKKSRIYRIGMEQQAVPKPMNPVNPAYPNMLLCPYLTTTNFFVTLAPWLSRWTK